MTVDFITRQKIHFYYVFVATECDVLFAVVIVQN